MATNLRSFLLNAADDGDEMRYYWIIPSHNGKRLLMKYSAGIDFFGTEKAVIISVSWKEHWAGCGGAAVPRNNIIGDYVACSCTS